MKVQIIKSAVNSAGHAHAESLLKSGAVDKTSDWSFSAEDGNKLLGSGGDDWANYAKWFLGADPSADKDTKAHYKYPFGKNGKVYRSAVIAIKSRSAQQKEDAIYNIADQMLSKIDNKAMGSVLGAKQRAWSTLKITSIKMLRSVADDNDEENYDEDQTGRTDSDDGDSIDAEPCDICGYVHDAMDDCPTGQDGGKATRPTGETYDEAAEDLDDEASDAVDVLGGDDDDVNDEDEDDPDHDYDEEEQRKPAMSAAARARRKARKGRKAPADSSDDAEYDEADQRKPAMVIEGIASTPSTDRAGDIVEAAGASFSLPMPFLWQHDSTQPLGHVTMAKPDAKGIPVRIEIPNVTEAGALRDRLQEAMACLKYGLVKGLSIGFAPVEYSYMEDTGGYRFLKWNWYELSAVTIPANMEASIAAIKSLDRKQLRRKNARTIVHLSKFRKAGLVSKGAKLQTQRKQVGRLKVQPQFQELTNNVAEYVEFKVNNPL